MNIKSVTLTKGKSSKEFTSFGKAGQFLGVTRDAIRASYELGKKRQGWEISVEYIFGCIMCGKNIPSTDDYCTPCYSLSLSGRLPIEWGSHEQGLRDDTPRVRQ